MNEIRVQIADWHSTDALRQIRLAVFVDEQQVPVELEWDDHDQQATHFLMLEGNRPVGTARLLADGHIGRVAVLPGGRGRGLGSRLMQAVMDHASHQGMRHLALSAQVQATDFYSRLGFTVASAPYMEAGIAHVDMTWNAAAPELAPIDFVSLGRYTIINPDVDTPARYTSASAPTLGDDPTLIEIDESNALSMACDLVLQVRRALVIHGAEQASWLFNRRDFIDCCEQLIAARPKCQIRILLQDVPREFLFGHSLAQLMHRFPSFCEIRKQNPELPRASQVYLLADAEGILMLPRGNVRQGFVRARSPDQVRRWSSSFNELWSSSQSDPSLRRFLL